MEYCVSPAVRNVLACSNLDGDIVEGRLVDSFAPEVVMAKFISGTASSIRTRSLFISWMIRMISSLLLEKSREVFPPF
jgi:hypothetical protein